jgi:putative aldouronate transport system permease protein
LVKKQKDSYADRIFDVINVIMMLLLLVVFVWPLWFVLIASVSDPVEVWAGHVILFPKNMTTIAYKTLLEYDVIWTGYANTIFYTAIGTVINLAMTVCCAYPLSRTDFMPRKVLLLLFMFTMYFSGGLIPNYLVVSKVGLLDTRWAMIVPGAISVYNMLVVRSYFMNSIPKELQEAATLDGANTAQYLWKVVLPLSKPVLAVVGLYYGVSHWNDFYTALLYIYDDGLLPLQSYLRNLLLTAQLTLNNTVGTSVGAAEIEALTKLEQTLKYSVIIVAAAPVLCIYPFIQKFFVKGIMIGSVKG